MIEDIMLKIEKMKSFLGVVIPSETGGQFLKGRWEENGDLYHVKEVTILGKDHWAIMVQKSNERLSSVYSLIYGEVFPIFRGNKIPSEYEELIPKQFLK